MRDGYHSRVPPKSRPILLSEMTDFDSAALTGAILLLLMSEEQIVRGGTAVGMRPATGVCARRCEAEQHADGRFTQHRGHGRIRGA